LGIISSIGKMAIPLLSLGFWRIGRK